MKHYLRIWSVAVFMVTLLFIAYADDTPGERTKSFLVKPGGTLDVSINMGNIHIHTWDKNEVNIRVTAEDEKDEGLASIRIRQSENTIHVETDRDSDEGGESDFDISIPSQFNAQLETSAGDITLSGKTAGTVEAQTSGGNISIGSVDGRADLTTSGGDVSTEDIKGDLTLSTSGGNVHVGVVTGITDVRTSGGDITIERANKKLTAETAGGNVRIGDIGGDAIVKTSGGDINLDHVAGSATLKTAGGNVFLTTAHGAVVARTAGGDIRADSIVGSIDAKTSAGNIEVLLIPSGAVKSKLSTSVGNVTLYIPENAKASITARNRMHYWGGWTSNEEVVYSDYKEDSYEQDERGREVRASYTLNGGGQSIILDASMGNIEILKPSSQHKDSHESKHKKRYHR